MIVTDQQPHAPAPFIWEAAAEPPTLQIESCDR